MFKLLLVVLTFFGACWALSLFPVTHTLAFMGLSWGMLGAIGVTVFAALKVKT